MSDEPQLDYTRFVNRLRTLFNLPVFNDIIFNCKDGKISSNRIILSIYSNFLMNVFEDNPLIITHPLSDISDTGINLPEIKVVDLNELLRVLSYGNTLHVRNDSLPGLQNVAKVLQINLSLKKMNDSFEVQAIPLLIKSEDIITGVKVPFKNQEYNDIDSDENNEYVDDVINDPDFESKLSRKRQQKSVNNCRDSVSVKSESKDCFNGYFHKGNKKRLMPKSRVCSICNMTCKSWQGMRRHIGHVHKEKSKFLNQQTVACDCGQTFSRNHNGKKLFRNHRTNCSVFKKAAFICEFCGIPFREMPALSNHKYKVHGINYERLMCLCGLAFGSSCSRRKHSLECNFYKNAAIFCDDCNSPFLTTNHLKQHLRSTGHGSSDNNGDILPKKVACKCGQLFSKYNRHLYKEHREKCSEFLKEAFVCDVCDAAFDALPSLTNHKYRSHGITKRPNTCVCGLSFRCSSSCRKHSLECEIYRRNANFCDECNLPFITKSHLENHLVSHRNSNVEKKATADYINGI